MSLAVEEDDHGRELRTRLERIAVVGDNEEIDLRARLRSAIGSHVSDRKDDAHFAASRILRACA